MVRQPAVSILKRTIHVWESIAPRTLTGCVLTTHNTNQKDKGHQTPIGAVKALKKECSKH